MLMSEGTEGLAKKSCFSLLLSQLAGRRGGEGMLNPATLSQAFLARGST